MYFDADILIVIWGREFVGELRPNRWRSEANEEWHVNYGADCIKEELVHNNLEKKEQEYARIYSVFSKTPTNIFKAT